MTRTPHIIVIMADQLRYDALGVHTPNTNQLMEDSVSFSRAYCASPLCVPARGSFFTGRYPNETGSLINPWHEQDRDKGWVQEDIPNLYSWLDTRWDSWHVGKQHLYAGRDGAMPSANTQWLSLHPRYEEYVAENGQRLPGGPAFRARVPELVSDRWTHAKAYSIPTTGCYEPGFSYFFDGFIWQDAQRALQQRDPERPFLLNAMFLAPHPPLDIPEPWYSLVDTVTLPENVGEWYARQSPLQLYNLPGFLGSRYTKNDWRHVWKVYLGLTALLDHCVGELVEALKQSGLYEDAVIVFTSDHGEMLGSHCLWQKMCLYEEAVRTPLAVNAPKWEAMAPGRVDTPVSSVDVFPTLCELAGVEAPAGVSGQSLVPLLRDPQAQIHRDAVPIQFDGNGALGNRQRALVHGDYKLIVDTFKDEVYAELYNVRTDAQETENLVFSENHQLVAENVFLLLREHMDATGDDLRFPADLLATVRSTYGTL